MKNASLSARRQLLPVLWLLSSLAALAADPDGATDAMAEMRRNASAIEATASGDAPTPAPDVGMSMGDTSDPMSGAAPTDSAQSPAEMKGMMGAMKDKMGKMKMSMDEMKGRKGSMMPGGKKGMGGMDSMGGMQMMGAMGDADSMKSALPGFPGASHLYHIGSTGFYLDHEEHITLSPEQEKALTEIAEKSRLEQATTDRQVAEANQALFTLTGADEPDADQIDVKITEIETLAGERRRTFIRQVGEAAQILTDDQRKILVGLPMPNDSAVSKSSASKPETSGGDMPDM